MHTTPTRTAPLVHFATMHALVNALAEQIPHGVLLRHAFGGHAPDAWHREAVKIRDTALELADRCRLLFESLGQPDDPELDRAIEDRRPLDREGMDMAIQYGQERALTIACKTDEERNRIRAALLELEGDERDGRILVDLPKAQAATMDSFGRLVRAIVDELGEDIERGLGQGLDANDSIRLVRQYLDSDMAKTVAARIAARFVGVGAIES